MKPNDENIAYCIKHKDFVNGLLETRGGAQHGDWFFCDDHALIKEVTNIASWEEAAEVHAELLGGGPETAWLPTEGDVLAMLVDQGFTPDLLSLKLTSIGGSVVVWFATDGVIMVPRAEDCHATPLIALLELLRVVAGDK